MMKYFLIVALSLATLFASDAFISPTALKSSLSDRDLVVLDVSERALYNIGHIEGAIHADVKEFIDTKSLKNYPALVSDNTIERLLRDLGINNSSRVVIYSHNSDRDIFNSSYLAFILLYSGVESVNILDGGYMAWVFEYDLLVSSLTPDIKEGDFTIAPKKDLIASSKDIEISDAKILDSRSYDEYYGVARSDGVLGIGHIRGAKCSNTATKFLVDNTIRDRSQLEQIYIAGHGLNSSDNIVVYAQDAISASMEFFILYKHMGFKNTKLYEASLLEWSNDRDLQMIRFKWE